MGSNPIARSTNENENILKQFLWRRGQVVRQGSAKSSSGVQIPSTPLQKQINSDLLFLFLFSYEKTVKKVYNKI